MGKRDVKLLLNKNAAMRKGAGMSQERSVGMNPERSARTCPNNTARKCQNRSAPLYINLTLTMNTRRSALIHTSLNAMKCQYRGSSHLSCSQEEVLQKAQEGLPECAQGAL